MRQFLLPPLFLLCSWTPLLHASASLQVDDAATTDEGQCQLETWLRRQPGVHEGVIAPACTHRGTEWSLALSLTDAAPATHWEAGAKRVLLENTRLAWAAAISHGTDLRHRANGSTSVALPVSISLGSTAGRWLHVQPGWHADDQHRGMTFGAGLELPVAAHWIVLLEHQRKRHSTASEQAGLRLQLHNGVSMDVLLGRQRGTEATRWLTFGLNVPLAR